jgi:hypothetical protein
MPWNDLCSASILYSFTPASARIFRLNRLITWSTAFTEQPRALAISSLE